jgi:tetratricopeptide (TPR) repeat protein
MRDKSWEIEEFIIPNIPPEPEYRGGQIAASGFNYQIAYTCLRLIDLLDSNARLKAIRVEGLQDVDLKFFASKPEEVGDEEYVQIKDVQDRWTFTTLAPILFRFLKIAQLLGEPCRQRVRFRLVAANKNFNNEANRLNERTLQSQDKEHLTKCLRKTSTDTTPERGQGTSGLDSSAISEQLDWLLSDEHFTIEYHGRNRERRPIPLSESRYLTGAGDEVNQEIAGWFSSDEASAIFKLQEVIELNKDKSQDAFNALRVEVFNALSGIGTVFNRDRLLDILKPYVAASTFEGHEGVRLINEKFFEIQRQEAEKEDQALSERERKGETIQFYQRPFRGKRARWQDIAVDRDFVRVKQQMDLDNEIVKRINPERPQGLVITGQRGEGKSALWMRTAKRWLSERQAFVYEIRDPDKFNNHLDQLARLAKSYTRDHLILLLGEDIYGADWDEWRNLCRSLKDLRLPRWAAPILLLATAPTDTISESNATVDGFLHRFSLQGVTREEKLEIGRVADLSETQIAALDDIRFLVAVLQATEGKGFEDRVRDWVLYSKDNFGDSGYPCLLDLCLVSRLGLSSPVGMHNRLGYSNCIAFPQRHGLEGNVSVAQTKGSQWGEWIEGPHAVLAEEFVRQSLSPFEITKRYTQISTHADPVALPERRFLIHLLRRLLKQGAPGKDVVEQLVRDHDGLVQQCHAKGSISELSHYWPQIYQALGKMDEAEQLRKKALTCRPMDRSEAVLLSQLLEQTGERTNAIEMLENYMGSHGVEAYLLASFLDLLTRKPKDKRSLSPEELLYRQEQLRRAEPWLIRSEQLNVQAWIHYLSLAAEYGNPGDYKRALQVVSERLDDWYKNYPSVWANVCEKYLALISRPPKEGRPKTEEEYADRQAVLRRVEGWIFEIEPPPPGVWVAYLKLAHKYGTGLDRDKALREVAARLTQWRSKYSPQAAKIFEDYLHLVDQWREIGAKKELYRAVTSNASAAHLDSIIQKWKQTPRLAETLQMIPSWVESPNLSAQLLDFTVRWGAETDWRSVLDRAVYHLKMSSLAESKDPQKLWTATIKAVELRGTDDDRQRLIEVARTLLATSENSVDLTIPWWVKFLKVLQVAVGRSNRDPSPIFSAVCVLARGPIPQDQWGALQYELGTEWRNPGSIPRNETVLYHLGALLSLCPREILSDRVRDSFAKWCQMFPRAKILHKRIVRLEAKAGDLAKAASLCQKLVNVYPTDPWIIRQNAKLCLDLKQFHLAENLLRKALSRSQTDTVTHVYLLAALEGEGLGKTVEAEQERQLVQVFNAVGPYPYGSSLAEENISDG